MKIAIDSSPLTSGHAYRGVGSYTRSLFQALQRHDPDNDYLFTPRPYESDADVVHYPYFDLFFLTLPMRKTKPTIVTIHDVIPLLYPQAYPKGIRGNMKLMWQKTSLRGVAAIVTDSDRSQLDIVRLLHQPRNKVNRVYLAAEDSFRPMPKEIYEPMLHAYGIKRPYMLYVGDINYNKNVMGLLESFSRIKAPIHLVIVSQSLNNNIAQSREIRQYVTTHNLMGRVQLVTDLATHDKDTLTGLYCGALWYIQPSFYEGFGLPVLEAIACKTLVVVSGGGSLPEITPPGSITFDPLIADDMVGAMEMAYGLTADKRHALIETAYQFGRQFTWRKTAEDMIAIYRSVL